MTPEATLASIEERHRADISLAWTTAMLHRTKDFPKSPDSLWGGPDRAKGFDNLDVMVASAKARFEHKQKLITRDL